MIVKIFECEISTVSPSQPAAIVKAQTQAQREHLKKDLLEVSTLVRFIGKGADDRYRYHVYFFKEYDPF